MDVDGYLPTPPHLRDILSIFLEESPTSGVYGTYLCARNRTPSPSAPQVTGLGFFNADAADPPTRSRAQQQSIRSMLGFKEILMRKPQSVPRIPHKLSSAYPHHDKKP